MIDIILKIAGKDNFKIDKRVSTSYMFRVCWKYGWMIIRGRLYAITSKNIANNIFLGKRVKIFEKKSLFIGEKSKICNNVKIDALSSSGVTIGSKVTIGERTIIECTGSLKNVGVGLSIGDRTTFANDCFFGAAGGIEIGSDVVAGQYIRFHSENHNYKDMQSLIKDQGVTHKGIKVGNNCWIGSGVVFLDGAELEEGCVVAANTIVTKKIPKNSVIAGIPAKIISVRG